MTIVITIFPFSLDCYVVCYGHNRPWKKEEIRLILREVVNKNF